MTPNRIGRHLGLGLVMVVAVLSAATPAAVGTLPPAGTATFSLNEHQTGAAEELPDARRLIERARDAAGGRRALEAIDSIAAKLTQFTEGGAVVMELVRDSAGRFRLKQFLPGMGPMETGFDGTTGWVNGTVTAGYQILEGAALALSRRQVGLHFLLLELEEQFESVQSVSRESFNGEEAVRVKLVGRSGAGEFAFFGEKTGRLLGVEGIERGVVVTRHFQEWKEFGGVRLFTKMQVERLNTEWTLEFTDIQINSVDPASFELPDEVKAKLRDP